MGEEIVAGDEVTWTFADGSGGKGVALSVDAAHALVAVNPSGVSAERLAAVGTPREVSNAHREFHPVIRCALTWLSKVSPE